MTWGMEEHVTERFASAGVAEGSITFLRDTWTFNFSGTPAEFVADFRSYYGPTMNAFEAAEAEGRATELQDELEALFDEQNTSRNGGTSIPATFLRVSVLTG
jgi:hypothetical protein